MNLVVKKSDKPITLALPVQSGSFEIQITREESIVFIGPNGTGKSRLGALLDRKYASSVHRISAHRALAYGPSASHRAIMKMK